MVSIGNVDLVMAALRARLQRMARDKRAERGTRTAATARSDAPERAETFGTLAQLPPEEFDRAFVRVLLERELGEGLAEDPRFHALVERTAAVLASDPETAAMLRRVQQEQS